MLEIEPITLIGDCHAFRVHLAHNHLGISSIPFKAWGKGGMKAWTFDPIKFANDHKLSEDDIDFSEIKDEGIVMIWLGYNDIKTALPSYKDPKETAERLIDNCLSYFKNAKLIFIEPLMQFKETIMAFPGEHDDHSYEKRQEQNTFFIGSLRNYCKINKLLLLNQDHLEVALWTKDLDISMTEICEHPTDGLRLEYYCRLYGLFLNEALKIQQGSIDSLKY